MFADDSILQEAIGYINNLLLTAVRDLVLPQKHNNNVVVGTGDLTPEVGT